jgi:hypothetical protein
VSFTTQDLEDLQRRGLAPAEAERQLALLRDPPPPPRLERACAIGDGIERLDAERQRALVARCEASRDAGEWTRFIPASGAATRMFQDLLKWLAAPAGPVGLDVDAGVAAGDPAARALREFVDGLSRFAFHDDLAHALAARGRPLAGLLERREYRPLLEVLLTPDGLGYATLPKGLLAFHRAADGARTAFDEQLAEGAPLVRDHAGVARFHFTVSPGHEALFRDALDPARRRPAFAGTRLEVGFSHQSPATDTIAAALDGGPFHDREGRLVFRPAGHGALIGNLGAIATPFAFVKNIDNIAAERLREPSRWWSRVLAGRAIELTDAVGGALARLGDSADAAAVEHAEKVLRMFGVASPVDVTDRRGWLTGQLRRPIRVCGMVPNTGEPGGGPFWVRDEAGGASLQVVEAAQVDARDAGQRAVFAGGTHFNPVFLAARLADPAGGRFDLDRFVDPAAVIVTRKSSGGEELVALERPGLWNGAMAGWRTVFVEVPGTIFTPVKTIHDLLRPEHQP